MKSVIPTLIAVLQASSLIPGPCPTYEPSISHERLNHTAMGGLWYEYAYTSDYRQDAQYECASWNLLVHTPNSTHKDTRFDLLHHSMNKTADKTNFAKFELNCGEEGTKSSLDCSLKTQNAPTKIHEMTVARPRNFQIVGTDMYSYLISSVCTTYGLAHYIDYLVLSREKEPSLYTRREML